MKVIPLKEFRVGKTLWVKPSALWAVQVKHGTNTQFEVMVPGETAIDALIAFGQRDHVFGHEHFCRDGYRITRIRQLDDRHGYHEWGGGDLIDLCCRD